MTVPQDRPADEVVADYRAAIADSDRAIQAAGPEVPTAAPIDGAPKSLRWVVSHMTAETARHVGLADVLREQIDGTTGR